MQLLLESVSVDSLTSGPVPCHAFRHQTESEGVVIVVYWIASEPEIQGFEIGIGDTSVSVPVHSVDAQNNQLEAEQGVVFYASIRESGLADSGVGIDLSIADSVVIVDPDGKTSLALPIHEYP